AAVYGAHRVAEVLPWGEAKLGLTLFDRRQLKSKGELNGRRGNRPVGDGTQVGKAGASLCGERRYGRIFPLNEPRAFFRHEASELRDSKGHRNATLVRNPYLGPRPPITLHTHRARRAPS